MRLQYLQQCTSMADCRIPSQPQVTENAQQQQTQQQPVSVMQRGSEVQVNFRVDYKCIITGVIFNSTQ